jgi:hypothetical protein
MANVIKSIKSIKSAARQPAALLTCAALVAGAGSSLAAAPSPEGNSPGNTAIVEPDGPIKRIDIVQHTAYNCEFRTYLDRSKGGFREILPSPVGPAGQGKLITHHVPEPYHNTKYVKIEGAYSDGSWKSFERISVTHQVGRVNIRFFARSDSIHCEIAIIE